MKDPVVLNGERTAACPYCWKTWSVSPSNEDVGASKDPPRSVRSHLTSCDERVIAEQPKLVRRAKAVSDRVGAFRQWEDRPLDEAAELTAASVGGTLGWTAATGGLSAQMLALGLIGLVYLPQLPLLKPGPRLAKRFAALDRGELKAIRANDFHFMGSAALIYVIHRLAFGPLPAELSGLSGAIPA